MDFAPLRLVRNLHRAQAIARVLLNHGFGDVVDQLSASGFFGWYRRWFRRRHEPAEPLTHAQRLRLVLEELGPTYVKLGQVMSTRPDLIPATVIAELVRLQEHVSAIPSAEAIDCVEKALGAPVSSLFASFDPKPLAAGSLGVVHRAVDFDGTQLAVKIRRPGIVREVEADLSLMLEMANILARNVQGAEVFDPPGLVDQFSRSIRRELQFTREGRTMDEFRSLFRKDATLAVPRVYWKLTSDSVITMEYLDGYRVSQRAEMIAAGLNPAEIAANGARIFMKMAFELGVFHGDPHPGNLRVLPTGVIGLIDYGMVGRLDDEKREQLIDLLLAVVERNARGAAEQVLRIGKPSRIVDRSLLLVDVQDFIETYYGIPLERLNVGNLLSDFVLILATHQVRCPADLMLLIRSIVTLEGVGRELDPEFNLAQHLAPFIQQQVRQRYNPQRIAGKLFDDATALAGMMHAAPRHVSRMLEQLAEGTMQVKLEHKHLEQLVTEIDRSSNRVVIGLVMSALIVASAMVMRLQGNAMWFVAVPTFLLSSVLGIWLIYGVFRSGRL